MIVLSVVRNHPPPPHFFSPSRLPDSSPFTSIYSDGSPCSVVRSKGADEHGRAHGSHLAIAIRWRWPPDCSCGNRPAGPSMSALKSMLGSSGAPWRPGARRRAGPARATAGGRAHRSELVCVSQWRQGGARLPGRDVEAGFRQVELVRAVRNGRRRNAHVLAANVTAVR
jgi:hypothetical protein